MSPVCNSGVVCGGAGVTSFGVGAPSFSRSCGLDIDNNGSGNGCCTNLNCGGDRNATIKG